MPGLKEVASRAVLCKRTVPFSAHLCRRWNSGKTWGDLCQLLCMLYNYWALQPETNDRLPCIGWAHDLSLFRVSMPVRDIWVSMEWIMGRLWLGRRHHFKNPLSQGHFGMSICKLRCGWVGRLYIRAYLVLSAGFLLSLGAAVGAGEGADLFAWQVPSACACVHHSQGAGW